MKDFKLKDFIYIVVLIVAVISSYYTAQMSMASNIDALHLIIKDNEKEIAINKTEIVTIKEKAIEINDNQKKQNEKTDEIFQLFYRYLGDK